MVAVIYMAASTCQHVVSVLRSNKTNNVFSNLSPDTAREDFKTGTHGVQLTRQDPDIAIQSHKPRENLELNIIIFFKLEKSGHSYFKLTFCTPYKHLFDHRGNSKALNYMYFWQSSKSRELLF